MDMRTFLLRASGVRKVKSGGSGIAQKEENNRKAYMQIHELFWTNHDDAAASLESGDCLRHRSHLKAA